MKIPMAVLHRQKNSSYSSFGRHTFVELDGGQNLDGPRYINLSAAASKVCSKHKEIYPSTSTGDRIPRSADRFSGDDIHFIPGKKFRVWQNVPSGSPEQICDPSETSKSNR